MKIALFGAGRLGSGMAERWLKSGETVQVWNRTADKARALESSGAKAFEDPVAALAGAEIVHIILSDDASVDGLLDRIIARIPKGTLVIDHTTTSPAGTAERGACCDQAGLEFLHVPVFMSPQTSREGKGLLLVSGPPARVQKAEAHLKRMTGEVWNVGEGADRAAAFKLFGNAMIATIVGGLSDVYAMARSANIDPRDAHTLFSHFKPSNSVDIRGKKMAEGDFTASFELTMARKDVRLMLEMAERADVKLHVLPSIAERIDELLGIGFGDRDLGVMAIDAASEAAAAG
ncbi:MAG: NAD(P)-dependent oxidoreductase [Vulcanimicrobiaceae bacterium]